MIKETDIAWLAGILDGEGCITTQLRYRPNAGLSTFLRINTISVGMAAKIKEIYDDLGVKYKQTTTHPREGYPPLINTTVSNMPDVITVLMRCIDYLTTKRPEAMEVLTYQGDKEKLHYRLRQLKEEVHVQAARL